MRGLDWLLAVIVGLAIFGAIELGGASLGVRAAITPEVWLDALVYALSAVLVRLVLTPAFRRARGFGIILGAIGFTALFAVVTGIVGGIVELTAMGGWGVPSLRTGAFTVTPVNVLLTFGLELWMVALPATFIGGLFLFAARGHSGRR